MARHLPMTSLSVLLGPAKTKAAHEAWSAIADGRQGEEAVLWVELFELLQCPKSLRGWHVVQRLAQEILHGRFAVQLINIRLTPLIACPTKVRRYAPKKLYSAAAIRPQERWKPVAKSSSSTTQRMRQRRPQGSATEFVS